eukprot:GILI01037085.1.p1 GENE.GILI01037085.1~~GILI01037085.1.p1  ORF type:complete len:313 (+),score=31.79 GILI01037085.1:1-939(+)
MQRKNLLDCLLQVFQCSEEHLFDIFPLSVEHAREKSSKSPRETNTLPQSILQNILRRNIRERIRALKRRHERMNDIVAYVCNELSITPGTELDILSNLSFVPLTQISERLGVPWKEILQNHSIFEEEWREHYHFPSRQRPSEKFVPPPGALSPPDGAQSFELAAPSHFENFPSAPSSPNFSSSPSVGVHPQQYFANLLDHASPTAPIHVSFENSVSPGQPAVRFSPSPSLPLDMVKDASSLSPTEAEVAPSNQEAPFSAAPNGFDLDAFTLDIQPFESLPSLLESSPRACVHTPTGPDRADFVESDTEFSYD